MAFIQFLCMLFPPVTAVALRNRWKKEKRSTIHNLIEFFALALIINAVVMLIMGTVLDYEIKIKNFKAINGQFALLYITFSIILTALVAFITCVFRFKAVIRPANLEDSSTLRVRILKNIFTALLLLVSFMLLLSTEWILDNFGLVTPEKLIFQLYVPIKGTDVNFIKSYIYNCVVTSLILLLTCMIIVNLRWKHKLSLEIGGFGKKLNLPLSPHLFFKKFPIAVSGIVLISGIVNFSFKMDINEFYNYTFNDSSFIKQNYVETKQVELKFPGEKRNLVHILMESMENTYKSEQLGGAQPKDLIPELSEISRENISFSNSIMGGAYQLPGTGWTIAAMTSQTAGLPLRIPIGDNSYGKYRKFLPGVWSLGDILEGQGYNQTLMVGSDADFGGRRDYYTQHGNFKILDYFTAIEDGVIPQDYKVWWGFEDKILYEYAKTELTRLSKQDKPFNFTLLTVDTHHIGGYVCDLCQEEYEYSYNNVIACASRQVSYFVEWLKEQDFFDNTTVVISGDHLSMDKEFFKDLDEDYIRTTYNAFINSNSAPKHNTYREFSTFDMFPTILASLGVKIEGDRLALGTNLFSDKPTLVEKYGVQQINDELNKGSHFYNNKFLH